MAQMILKLAGNIAKYTKATGGKYRAVPFDIQKQKDLLKTIMVKRFPNKKFGQGHAALKKGTQYRSNKGSLKTAKKYQSPENDLIKQARKVLKNKKSNIQPNKNDIQFLNYVDEQEATLKAMQDIEAQALKKIFGN